MIYIKKYIWLNDFIELTKIGLNIKNIIYLFTIFKDIFNPIRKKGKKASLLCFCSWLHPTRTHGNALEHTLKPANPGIMDNPNGRQLALCQSHIESLCWESECQLICALVLHFSVMLGGFRWFSKPLRGKWQNFKIFTLIDDHWFWYITVGLEGLIYVAWFDTQIRNTLFGCSAF